MTAATDPFATLERYQIPLTFMKDLLEVIWKVAPVALIMAAIYLWNYLNLINWPGLFYESTASGTGLLYLVLFAAMLYLTIVLLFVVPSFFMALSSANYPGDQLIPIHFSGLHLVTISIWLLSFALMGPVQGIGAYAVIPPTIAALIFSGTFLNELAPGASSNWWKRVSALAKLSFSAVFAAVSTVFTMSVSFKVATLLPDRTQYDESSLVVLSVAVCLVGTIPGFMFLIGRARTVRATQTLALWAAGLVIIAYAAAGAFINLPPLQMMLQQSMGLYSREAVRFQLLNDNLAGAFKAVGISVDEVDKINTVTAYVRYRFGGTILLCKTLFDPFAAASAQTGTPGHADQRGSDCAPTRDGDLRELRLPALVVNQK